MGNRSRGENEPVHEKSLVSKATKILAVGAGTLALVAGGVYGFARQNNEIELESLAAGTSIDLGEHKMTKEVPLENVEVMGYTVEYEGIVVSRKIESTIDLNKLNPLDRDVENRIIETVDINTESILKINNEELKAIDVQVDEDEKTVNAEMSQGSLLVQSRTEPGSLKHDPDQEGINVKIKSGHDGVVNEGEYLEKDRNDILNLAEYVAIHQSDNMADQAVANNLPMLEDRIEEEIIDYLDIKDQGYAVELTWVDDGEKPTVVDKEKHEAAITDLGGDEILNKGKVTVPDETGGNK